MYFGEKLIQLRKSNGLSQEDLADSLGVSRQAVSRWEQGSTYPDFQNIRKLMDLFHVSADYLLCDDHEKSIHPDAKPNPEEVSQTARFDFRDNRFLIIGFIWIFAATCFLVAAIDTLNILYVGLVLADVLLACVNFYLHFHKRKR